jgi:hypothetical protein
MKDFGYTVTQSQIQLASTVNSPDEGQQAVLLVGLGEIMCDDFVF